MTRDLESPPFRRPSRRLLAYYGLMSLAFGPFFWVAFLPLWVRFQTLEYRFGHHGAAMRWGRLFRREVNLSYSRIQDIHLISNVVERWLGLARIRIQTASGNARAEMTIVGIVDYETLRDELYARAGTRAPEPATADQASIEMTALADTLAQVAVELRGINQVLRETGSGADDD